MAHGTFVMIASAVCGLVSAYVVVTRLPVKADLSYLLPPDAPAVRDLRRLGARLVTRDTALVIVAAPDPRSREIAVARFAAEVREIERGLVERIEIDDHEERAFFAARKYLYVPAEQLRDASETLRQAIAAAKLARNPLFIDLETDDRGAHASPSPAPRQPAGLQELRARVAELDARLSRSRFISADGRTGLVVVGTAFPTTDVSRARQLVARLAAIRDRVVAATPGVEIGLTGGVPTALAEQRALVEGIAWSSLLTAVLVTTLLAWYLRSARLVGLLIATLAVAIVASFATAAYTIGHLNAATAFLGAIIAGNGINYGILLVARLREERAERSAGAPAVAMARALAGTLRPTLVASLGAAIAYGSLAATSFRGFADFAWIGAIGMVTCWVASYVLLPVLVLRFAARIDRAPPRWLGAALARVFGSWPPSRMLAVASVVSAGALVLVTRYVADDPLEYDLKALRSSGQPARDARRWIAISDREFGKSISGRIVFAADRADQVPLIVDALKRVEAERAPEDRILGGVTSVLDVIPPDQEVRLAILDEIRAQLDDPALAASDSNAVADLQSLRPPDSLRPVTPDQLPRAIRDALTERDGRFGLLVAVRAGPRVDQWNGHHLLRLAGAVRTLRLENQETVTTSGSSIVFADIVDAIATDGPRVTLVAILGLVVLIVVIVRRPVACAAVLVATGAGTVAMIAIASLIGLRVNFLDFVALPITLGLGVDYAINMAARSTEDTPERALAIAGPAVLVCSLTTVIGYASLLVSDNGAIRSFGIPLLIGEITSVIAAFAFVPAMLARRRTQ